MAFPMQFTMGWNSRLLKCNVFLVKIYKKKLMSSPFLGYNENTLPK